MLCNTLNVKFHESLWVAISAAAPVIALAAVVLVPYWSVKANLAVDARVEAERPGSNYSDYRQKRLAQLSLAARYVWSFSVVNICIQAFLLYMSLWSLEDQHNDLRPDMAIDLAVTGLVLLAISALNASRFQNGWREMHGGKEGV